MILSMTPSIEIYRRVVDLPTRTPVSLGIRKLSQQVQVLNNVVLAIQEHLYSLQYN
jgi:hypothetical protein